ncbi:chaplin, partial [Streptomyces clavuligerus]
MRQVTRKGLITIAAAGGALALGGGYAHAGSGASGAAVGSPGVASGNAVQVPVSVPVNVCGNSVNVVGLLNPTFGNNCVNESSGPAAPPVGGPGQGPGGTPGGLPPVAEQGGGAQATGVAANSPGVGSGNVVQVPVEVPVNACGNSVDAGGVLNPAFGNECVNESAATPPPPPPVKPPTPPVKPPTEPPVKPPTTP